MSDIAQSITPPTLEYATRASVGMDAATLAHFRRYASRSLLLAILSGLCVGVCFLTITFEHQPVVGMIHAAIFFATLVNGYLTGGALISTLQSFGEPRAYRSALILDIIAGVGLGMLAVAPLGYELLPPDEWKPLALYLCAAYACFTVSVPRHRIHYRAVAMLMAAHGSVYIGGMRVLGMVKMIYEGIWLLSCTLALLCIGLDFEEAAIILAMGALFGCMGFAGIWVWMIVRHAMLHRRVRSS